MSTGAEAPATGQAPGPTTAMVLAAGLGTRMLHLTKDRPKPLIEVDGRALIDHMLDRLAEAGVEHAVVNLFHMADQLETHLAGRTEPRITTVMEPERLETGGGVAIASAAIG